MKVISKSDKLLTKSTRSISLSDYGCLRTEGHFFSFNLMRILFKWLLSC